MTPLEIVARALAGQRWDEGGTVVGVEPTRQDYVNRCWGAYEGLAHAAIAAIPVDEEIGTVMNEACDNAVMEAENLINDVQMMLAAIEALKRHILEQK